MEKGKNFKQKFEKINRALHRDLGYLFIGMTLIYGISGIAIMLRHMDVNIIYDEIEVEKIFSPNATKEEFTKQWESYKEFPELQKMGRFSQDTCSFRLENRGRGIYVRETGEVFFTMRKYNPFIKFVNDIHYDRGRRFTWIAFVYAFMLVFFAFSGAIIAKGKKGFMKRGIWLTLLGISVPVLCYFLM